MFRLADAALPVTLRRWSLVALACAAVVLNGCGGGSRAKAYVPDSMVSFGDENSLLEDYSSTTLDPAGGTAKKTIYGMVYTVNTVAVGEMVRPDISIPALFAYGKAMSGNINFGVYEYCTDQTATAYCVKADLRTDVDAASFVQTSASTFYFDDLNYTEPDGTKPGANVVTTVALGTGNYAAVTAGPLKRTIDRRYLCAANTIWVQTVAHGFGFGFQGVKDACPTDSAGAMNYAKYGAKVAGVVQQINDHIGDLHSGVLVTIMVGQHDILELYKQYHVDGVSASDADTAAATTELKSRAATMATAVRRVLATGAKVILALTPDLGESPKAYAPNQDRAFLAALTVAFNDALYITQLGDSSGREIAGVNPISFTAVSAHNVSYVYNTALCRAPSTGSTDTGLIRPDGTQVAAADAEITADPDMAVKYCTNTTDSLVTGGSTATYIWADNTHFAPLGHSLIGSAALTRATNQF